MIRVKSIGPENTLFFDSEIEKSPSFVKFYSSSCSHCINMKPAWDDMTNEILKDVKRRSLFVKFILEWVQKLAETSSSQALKPLLDSVYANFFNTESSNEVNITLLEILPHYCGNSNYFQYVK